MKGSETLEVKGFPVVLETEKDGGCGVSNYFGLVHKEMRVGL